MKTEYLNRKEKLSARMVFAVPPSLLEAFQARAKAMNLDTPALARAAMSIVAQRGLDLGPSKKEVIQERELA